jgi:DNA integrity scanning protein DisA with diadenylate cyclase activity
MSPLKIKMLLHYYAHVQDYRDEADPAHANSPAVAEAIQDFLQQELIEERNPRWVDQPANDRFSQYGVTAKGYAMVEHLCAVQIPVCHWTQP